MTRVDVLHRELVTLELVLPLQCVGAGARDTDADEHRVAAGAGRVGADRLLLRRKRPSRKSGRQRQAAGDRQAGADEIAATPQGLPPVVILHDVLLLRVDFSWIYRSAIHRRVYRKT